MESLRTPAKTAPAGCSCLIKAFVQSCIGWLHRGWQDGWSGEAGALPRAIELTLDGPQLGHVRQIVPLAPGGAA